MHPREHLDDILRCILPTDAEKKAVQRRVDEVLVHARRFTPIAELHPAGSWAKGTMLLGRKEADLVAVLARAPDAGTLDSLASHMNLLGGLRRKADTSIKAVQLTFQDDVSIDLLPVARVGTTPDGPSVPRKLRHALAGIEHVQWLKDNAHGTVLLPVIRLAKHFRNCQGGELEDLSSFAIEVMCVEMGCRGDLFQAFSEVLRKLGDGWLSANNAPRRLGDPANNNNDLLEGISLARRDGIARKANRAVSAIGAQTWSQVFPTDSGTLPPPAGNLGGRTLG